MSKLVTCQVPDDGRDPTMCGILRQLWGTSSDLELPLVRRDKLAAKPGMGVEFSLSTCNVRSQV